MLRLRIHLDGGEIKSVSNAAMKKITQKLDGKIKTKEGKIGVIEFGTNDGKGVSLPVTGEVESVKINKKGEYEYQLAGKITVTRHKDGSYTVSKYNNDMKGNEIAEFDKDGKLVSTSADNIKTSQVYSVIRPLVN